MFFCLYLPHDLGHDPGHDHVYRVMTQVTTLVILEVNDDDLALD